MIVALVGLLSAMAVIAWLVVVYSAVRIVGLAATGTKLAALGLLLRGQFAALVRLAGEATIPYANRFLLGGMAFLGCLAAGAAIAMVLLIDRLAGS